MEDPEETPEASKEGSHEWAAAMLPGVRIEQGRPDVRGMLRGEVGTATGSMAVTGGFVASLSPRWLMRRERSVWLAGFDAVGAGCAEVPGVGICERDAWGAECDVARRVVWVCLGVGDFYYGLDGYRICRTVVARCRVMYRLMDVIYSRFFGGADTSRRGLVERRVMRPHITVHEYKLALTNLCTKDNRKKGVC